MLQVGKVYLMDDFMLTIGVFALTVSEVLNNYENMLSHHEPYVTALTVVARLLSIASASIFIYSKWKAWKKSRNEKPK